MVAFGEISIKNTHIDCVKNIIVINKMNNILTTMKCS